MPSLSLCKGFLHLHRLLNSKGGYYAAPCRALMLVRDKKKGTPGSVVRG